MTISEKKGLITYIKEINFELSDFLLMFGFLSFNQFNNCKYS